MIAVVMRQVGDQDRSEESVTGKMVGQVASVHGDVVSRSRGGSAAVTTISTTSLRMLKPFAGERFPQLGQRVRPVGPDRLLHQVVEQLLDERGRAPRRCRPGTSPARGRRRTSPSRRSASGSVPVASTGLPFSFSRYRPTASKFSSVKPSGLISAVARLARLALGLQRRRARGWSASGAGPAAAG